MNLVHMVAKKKNKTAKKSPPSKKTKAVTKKSSAKKIAPKREAQKEKKVLKPLVVKPAQVPERAPQRKVIGSDRSVKVIEARARPELKGEAVVLTDLLETKVESPVVAVSRPMPVVAKPIARVAWSALSQSVSPQIRFFVSMAEKECRSASTWPFPYAKFLSALPVKVCGRAFAAFLLWFDHNSEIVAQKLSMPVQELDQLVAGEGAQMLEFFSETCPDMYRKLATQLGGVGVSIDNLAERYLVSKVDKDFQLLIASLMLKLMSR